MLNIVLMQPEIPQNTGNISRTCAATGCHLHLVGPKGFTITDKSLKRAGVDYWHLLKLTEYESTEEFFNKNSSIKQAYFASSHGQYCYANVSYEKGCYLFFGRESAGLDKELLRQYHDQSITIPIREEARSLNLSNAVAVILFKALEQHHFPFQ